MIKGILDVNWTLHQCGYFFQWNVLYRTFPRSDATPFITYKELTVYFLLDLLVNSLKLSVIWWKMQNMNPLISLSSNERMIIPIINYSIIGDLFSYSRLRLDRENTWLRGRERVMDAWMHDWAILLKLLPLLQTSNGVLSFATEH